MAETRSLSLASRPSTPPVRCAVCHDSLEKALAAASCPHCQTVLHVECWSALGRCPTLGCQASEVTAAVIAARAHEEEEEEPPSFWLALGLSCLTSFFA